MVINKVKVTIVLLTQCKCDVINVFEKTQGVDYFYCVNGLQINFIVNRFSQFISLIFK
jgi:hypothetical protein